MADQKNRKPFEELTWTAAEFEHTAKDSTWYLTIGGLGFVFVLLSLWQKDYFFIFFLVIAFGFLIWNARQHPRVLEFTITAEGVQIDTKLFRYEQFEQFSVRSRPGHLDELVFRKRVAVNPFLHIPIDAALAKKAATTLRAMLPEGEFEESLLDTLTDWLRV